MPELLIEILGSHQSQTSFFVIFCLFLKWYSDKTASGYVELMASIKPQTSDFVRQDGNLVLLQDQDIYGECIPYIFKL